MAKAPGLDSGHRVTKSRRHRQRDTQWRTYTTDSPTQTHGCQRPTGTKTNVPQTGRVDRHRGATTNGMDGNQLSDTDRLRLTARCAAATYSSRTGRRRLVPAVSGQTQARRTPADRSAGSSHRGASCRPATGSAGAATAAAQHRRAGQRFAARAFFARVDRSRNGDMTWSRRSPPSPQAEARAEAARGRLRMGVRTMTHRTNARVNQLPERDLDVGVLHSSTRRGHLGYIRQHITLLLSEQ